VLSSDALLPFLSVWKAAALAIAQLGIGAFFIAGVTSTALGASAAWFVLAATLLAAFVRAIDVESWALLIPGGFVSRVTGAFGMRAAGLAKAAVLVERVLLGALAAIVIGHYVASVSATAIAGWRFTGFVRPEDLATVFAVAVVVSASGLATVLSGDVATIATLMFITLLTAWFTAAVPKTARVEARADESSFDLLLAAELSPDQIEARPGNVLVPVRNPHLLAHVVAALQTSGDRDVVVMTARMLDVDVSEESAGQTKPTAYERRLLSDVVALAERVGRPVRLLIVPTRNVVEAIVGTVIRLRSSDVYVGESSTLSAEDHSVNYARRRGAMGNAQRLAAAVPAQAAGIRSGRIFGAVRGYAGGRHRTRVVFFGRVDRLERHVVVGGSTCNVQRAGCYVLPVTCYVPRA
jgi:hypothetical protein